MALASLTMLAGCGHSPPTQFFTLDPVAPDRSLNTASDPKVRIDHVTIPAVMDRPELVREYAADQLKVDDFSHWGAPLGDLMRATLIEDLSTRLASGRVLPAAAPRPDGVADLTVEITAIHEGAGKIFADVDWTLTQPLPLTNSQGPAKTPAQTVRTLRHERIDAPLGGSAPQAFAAALSQVIGTLADRIAGALSPGG